MSNQMRKCVVIYGRPLESIIYFKLFDNKKNVYEKNIKKLQFLLVFGGKIFREFQHC